MKVKNAERERHKMEVGMICSPVSHKPVAPKNEIIEPISPLQKHIDRWGAINAMADMDKHIDRWGVINEKDNLQREIYTVLLQEDDKYRRYSRSQVKKYVMEYSDYSEWIWDNKINRMCPEPFSFHIKTGSFIADEMRGQVVGLWREKTKDGWSSLAVMTKWEWRYMDEDSLQTYKSAINSIHGMPSEEREYYIINTEQMECDIEEDLLEAMDYLEENGEVPDDIDEDLCHQIELEAERLSDIRRGK